MNEKYIPLYRKYRPQALEEIVGQEHIKTALANAIELDKISHAYLFTGPRGTGKTSTARIFAKSLNCKKGPTEKPCGVCENCVDITNSTPMDVIEIDAASNRKVEDAQNILEKVVYAPINSKYKIYIIDEVHMLSTTAFNALLKTLEEPPKNVVFILATTEVHKVLDTIKSRCQRFDFKRITVADITGHLKNIAKLEKINIDDEAISLIAKSSAGGMRDSIALLDQISILGVNDAITVDDINNLLGRLSFELLSALSEKIISSDSQDAVEILENIYNKGSEPVQILTNLMDYFKNLLIVKNCRDEIVSELTQANDSQIKTLKSQAENLETHQIVALIEKCSDYIKELKLTNNPRLWLEVAVIDFANLTENTKLADLQERLSRIEGGQVVVSQQPVKAPVKLAETKQVIETKPEPKIEPKIEPVQAEVEVKSNKEVLRPAQNDAKAEDFAPMPKAKVIENSGNIQDDWNSLLENIQSPPTRALLKQWAAPVEIAPGNVIISMKNEALLKQFVDGNKKQILTDAVDAMFGQKDSKVFVRLPQPEDLKIEAQSAPKTKPQPSAKPSKPEVQEIEDEVVEEALEVVKASELPPVQAMYSDQVNMAVDIFDAKVMD